MRGMESFTAGADADAMQIELAQTWNRELQGQLKPILVTDKPAISTRGKYDQFKSASELSSELYSDFEKFSDTYMPENDEKARQRRMAAEAGPFAPDRTNVTPLTPAEKSTALNEFAERARTLADRAETDFMSEAKRLSQRGTPILNRLEDLEDGIKEIAIKGLTKLDNVPEPDASEIRKQLNPDRLLRSLNEPRMKYLDGLLSKYPDLVETNKLLQRNFQDAVGTRIESEGLRMKTSGLFQIPQGLRIAAYVLENAGFENDAKTVEAKGKRYEGALDADLLKTYSSLREIVSPGK